ncbi:hypothetical protein QBC32DRAFT_312509, partial [Pseudoneurospora amorphoporcata]
MSRFIHGPQANRSSKERTQALLTFIITPFFSALYHLHLGPRYGFMFRPGEMGATLHTDLYLVQAHYTRRLRQHFFISPAREHAQAIHRLRQLFLSLEDILMD